MSEVLEAKPPTVRITKAPGTSSGAGRIKADQEELQGHHPQSNMEKTWKNHRKPWLAVGVVSSTAIVYPVHFEELRVMFKHLPTMSLS